MRETAAVWCQVLRIAFLLGSAGAAVGAIDLINRAARQAEADAGLAAFLLESRVIQLVLVAVGGLLGVVGCTIWLRADEAIDRLEEIRDEQRKLTTRIVRKSS